MNLRSIRLGPALLVGGVVLLLVAGLLVFLGRGSDDTNRTDDRSSGSDSLISTDRAGDNEATLSDDDAVDGKLKNDSESFFGTPLGLAGKAFSLNTPGRTIRLSVTSSAPIGTIGFIVPTSRDRSSGVVKGIGRSWSYTTTVYGPPGYARLFVQAGYEGTPIRCSITVTGGPSNSQTAKGPYGQSMCQA